MAEPLHSYDYWHPINLFFTFVQKLKDFVDPGPSKLVAVSFIVSVGLERSCPTFSYLKSTAHWSGPPLLIIFSISAFCIAICSSIIYYCILIEYWVIMTVTPSIRQSIVPPITAFLNAAWGPDLKARTPPVINPLIMALNGSSVYL